jgi:hypothetical protein
MLSIPAPESGPRQATVLPPASSLPAPGRESEREVPPPATQRELLTATVGIDPATVTILQDQDAEPAAASRSADAFTAGEVMVLPARQAADMPSSLGLLAHELTHVAQARQPRFLPPILRELEATPGDIREPALSRSAPAIGVIESGPALRRSQRAPSHAFPSDPSVVDGAGTEAVALAVEARVAAVARGGGASIAPSPAPEEPPAATTAGWNGLPAPWEPLPSWLAPTMPAAGSPPPVSPTPVQFAGLADQQSVGNDGAGETALVVQRAETGRQVPATEPATMPQEGPQPQPEPDLDALARQVYAVLSRRLAVERRRLG